ncbi:Zinc finger protein RFP [Chelonia mydas]|uniref:Zinc finger protein RFP n=1 Tax=Chelonia mydas TaxID=8469 RepID=M7CDN3_CHEMY|nr:Zinc finger protein RFP [Chelonia mydas]
MAAVNPLKSFRDEATCSICLSFYKDPVFLDCGHSFCQACIAQCWEGSDTAVSCPQCRDLSPEDPQAEQTTGELCGNSQAAEFPNSSRRRESQAHRTHRVVPTEEAAQAYKEQIQTQLNTLKQERGELLEWKQDAEMQSREYLGKIEAERQKIMSEFEQLRQFLDEQERLLLAQLEELDKEIVKIQDENVTQLSEKISRLSDLISEIEEKCQQPTSEFLQVRQLETPRSLPREGRDSD